MALEARVQRFRVKQGRGAQHFGDLLPFDARARQAGDRLEDDRRAFLLNLICFACCIEGLFFFAAFAYVTFMRSKGLLNGLASGTNWVFRDESMHMQFALEQAKLQLDEGQEKAEKAA